MRQPSVRPEPLPSINHHEPLIHPHHLPTEHLSRPARVLGRPLVHQLRTETGVVDDDQHLSGEAEGANGPVVAAVAGPENFCFVGGGGHVEEVAD